MAHEQQAGAPRRSLGVVAGVVAALGVVVFVVVLARSGGAPSETAATAPEQTLIHVASEPAGASVVLGDGGVLGVTPFEVTLPKINGELPVVVKLDGYQARRTTIPLFSASGRVDVALTPVGVDAAAPPSPPKDWAP